MKTILGVFDKPEIRDRYTVVFTGCKTPGHFTMLGMSHNPNNPMGVCTHGEGVFKVDGVNAHLGKRIRLTELPSECTRKVVEELGGITHTSNLSREYA